MGLRLGDLDPGMKVTNFGPDGIPIALGGWSTGITSINSNAVVGDGGPSATNFVQLITADSSNTMLDPIVNFASGSNIVFSFTSNTIRIASTASGSGGFTNPMTTAGDIILGDTGGAAIRLAKGADSEVLTVDPTTHLPLWAASASGFSDPMTTRGDIIVRDAANATARLAVGASTYVLTSDGTDVAWAAASGVAPTHLYPLDQYALNGTYGDDFTGAALSGIWTRRNFTSGAETYQLGPTGSFMRIAFTGRAVGDGYFQTAPAGDWTFMMSWVSRYFGATLPTWGIACINSVGTGIATKIAVVTGNAFILGGVTTYTTYSGAFQQNPAENILGGSYGWDQRKTWVYLRKSGTNYYAAYSLNGETWGQETPAFSSAITVDRIGMFVHPQSAIVTTAQVDVDLFNKIA